MKKIFDTFLFVFLFFMFCFTVSAAEVPTIEQIAEKFNNHPSIKEINNSGMVTINGVVKDNKLVVNVINNEENYVYDFLLVDNIYYLLL